MNNKNEMIEESSSEIETTVENEHLEEQAESILVAKKEKKEKKHQHAVRLVEQAKQIVKDAHEQTEACKLLLVGDLKEYEEAKRSLRAGGYDACSSLLEQLGYTNQNDEPVEENIVVFEPKEEIAPITLKNVSSGKFTGFMLSLLGGVVTAVGLAYLATEKLGLTLDITKVPSSETLEKIATWFSTAVGLEPNVYVGAGIVGVASLAVMAIIYAIRVSLRGSKNLHFAVKQLAEAELYTEEKGNCKAEMDKVDAHMKETVTLLKMYEVLFNEQKGKLERILHIEGSKEKSSDYHEKSFLEIRDTKELLRTIKDFISTPMSQEGKLSEKSVQLLQRAKTQMDRMLERLY
ncbi:MAG: hypothetical protein FAF03_03945 [Epsilonproteobacteria bacterium]|nr:hypothetical protein [Campylobacterota bacterium]